jgi:hypothetical protein
MHEHILLIMRWSAAGALLLAVAAAASIAPNAFVNVDVKARIDATRQNVVTVNSLVKIRADATSGRYYIALSSNQSARLALIEAEAEASGEKFDVVRDVTVDT